jgi:biopolymer transport protein ExbB
LGLLGTVGGMIKVFRDVAGVDNPDISLLARGIWEALLTTGFGLTVAIPTYVAYRLIEARIERHGRNLEEAAIEVLNALYPSAPDTADTPQDAPEP